jgi:hypothetical protein
LRFSLAIALQEEEEEEEEEEFIRLPWLGQSGLAARALPLRCAASTVLSSTLLAIGNTPSC